MPCTLGKMKSLTYSQMAIYMNAIRTFTRVEAYNQNVFTLRATGLQVSYYTFVTMDEANAYTLGRFILLQNNPTNASLYIPVEKI